MSTQERLAGRAKGARPLESLGVAQDGEGGNSPVGVKSGIDMHVLHAVWLSGRERLFFWAESSELMAASASASRGRPARVPTHPFALAADDLQAALPPCPLQTAETTIWLPRAAKGTAPLASPALGADVLPVETLAPFSVPGCSVEAANACLLLAAGTDNAAPDFNAWTAASRWVLSLMSRERLFPSLVEDRALWLPLLDDEDDQRRLLAIAAAIPPVGRQTGDAAQAVPARDALLSFVRHAVDGLARRVRQMQTLALRNWPEEVTAWLAALSQEKPEVHALPNALKRLRGDLARWTSPLQSSHGAPPPFRTCFRLEPPATNAQPRVASANASWHVSILAQASDDPSLLVSAPSLWSARKSRFGHDAADRLLADLGRATRVFPPLQRALKSARPETTPLTGDEAAEFLRAQAWLLKESGFGVLVPSERLLTGDALRLRVRVREKHKGQSSTSQGILGLDTIVSYDWEVSVGDQTLSAEEFRSLARAKQGLVSVRGQWVLLDPRQVERALRAWDRDGLSLGDVLRQEGGVGLPDDGVAVDLQFEGRLRALDGNGALSILDVPDTLQATLRPYQQRGYSWMAFLHDRGLGACLADDMGLGKTMQVITLLLSRKGTTLLICPTSLVGNWLRETARFAPSLRVGVHHGTERKRDASFGRWARKHDLILTTYGLVARDHETLSTVDWDGVVLDEAQNVKNPDSRQARATRQLPAKFRVAMTGTPVENRLSDLWSIMEFLNPGLLGKREEFRRKFAIPVEKYGDHVRASMLRKIAAPFLLRRLKTDPTIIADLPEKMEMKVYCPLTREQATLYQATVNDMLARIESSDGMERRGLVLALMLRLKQICDHPALFLGDGSKGSARSGKLQRLEEMLEEVVLTGDRALVFTQFSEMGEQLQKHLGERFGVPVLFLHGGVGRKARDEMVERFQSENGPPIFVLSVKAGGVGLNLVAASHVFHFDRWWNPAVENQATDRAFRIGQKKNVQVHKMICQGTLEEAIDALIESKLALSEQVVGSGEGWLTELDTKQLRKLFTLGEGAVEEDV